MAKDYMGKQHYSEPETDEDKVMSSRHKSHRRMLSGIKDRITRLKRSIPYNDKHSDEHKDQNKKNRKELKKLTKTFSKAGKRTIKIKYKESYG